MSARPTPPPTGRRTVPVVRLVIGAALIAAGAVLWVVTGQPAYGLVSGLGVVIAYIAAEPWLERWRNS